VTKLLLSRPACTTKLDFASIKLIEAIVCLQQSKRGRGGEKNHFSAFFRNFWNLNSSKKLVLSRYGNQILHTNSLHDNFFAFQMSLGDKISAFPDELRGQNLWPQEKCAHLAGLSMCGVAHVEIALCHRTLLDSSS
jgi:hypothetical protein